MANIQLSVWFRTLYLIPICEVLGQKKLKKDCSDVRKCVERKITKRGIVFLIVADYATYVAREMGTVIVGKVIFSFDETLLSSG